MCRSTIKSLRPEGKPPTHRLKLPLSHVPALHAIHYYRSIFCPSCCAHRVPSSSRGICAPSCTLGGLVGLSISNSIVLEALHISADDPFHQGLQCLHKHEHNACGAVLIITFIMCHSQKCHFLPIGPASQAFTETQGGTEYGLSSACNQMARHAWGCHEASMGSACHVIT